MEKNSNLAHLFIIVIVLALYSSKCHRLRQAKLLVPPPPAKKSVKPMKLYSPMDKPNLCV